MNKIKKGFTLAEVVVTLAVIGMVAGISIPILHNAKIDKDVIVYRKAMYTLQQAANKYMNGNNYQKQMRRPNSNENLFLGNFTEYEVCAYLSLEMNTKGFFYEQVNEEGITEPLIWDTTNGINCYSSCDAEASNCADDLTPNFTTSDGISFYNLGGKADTKFDKKVILIKRENEKESERAARISKGSHNGGFMRIEMNRRGKFSINNDWEFEQSLVKNYTKLKAE